MRIVLVRAINWFADIIILLLLVYAMLSWFANSSQGARRAYMALGRFLDPFIAPARALLSRFRSGMFDWSVFLTFFIVRIGANILIFLVNIIF